MRGGVVCSLPVLAVVAILGLACQIVPARAPAVDAPPAAAPAPPTPRLADEQAVASFYRGKTVRFIVGFPAGGGFDTYTRAIARHISKYIPGNPTVIVENMPGAGSLIAANYVYAATRPDGLTIGNWIGGLILQQVLGAQGIEFDARRYRFLGVPVPDNVVCAVRKESGFRSFSDAINSPQPLILGGSAPGSSTDDPPKVLAAAIGLNLKLVSGYGGTAPIRQAADAGEIHGGCWAWESIKVTWKAGLEAGDVIVIGQVTERKLPDLPNVESALDLAKTDEARQLIRSGIIVPSRITRPYAVHPDTPPERLAALRQAFMAVLKDPGLLEDAQKASLDIDPVPGEEVEQLVRELFETPEHIKAQLRALLLPS
ncbi:MAG TPA: tripartite tricarboxylate transporter substrate-binding protein [Chloroflexota bacterium]|nr:tripartite tricarboxylate transporter substrate-binding protein [Chloroflexota bacterium]